MALELAVQLDRLGELETAESRPRRGARRPRPPRGAPRRCGSIAPDLPRPHLLRPGPVGRGRPDHRRAPPAVDADVAPADPPRRSTGCAASSSTTTDGIRESLEQHDRALAIARSQHDEREIALETVRRANVLGMIPGRFDEAVADYRGSSPSPHRSGRPQRGGLHADLPRRRARAGTAAPTTASPRSARPGSSRRRPTTPGGSAGRCSTSPTSSASAGTSRRPGPRTAARAGDPREGRRPVRPRPDPDRRGEDPPAIRRSSPRRSPSSSRRTGWSAS